MSEESRTQRRPERPDRPTTIDILSEAIGRVRRDPALAVPFALAGVVLTVVDWLRLWDPIPARTVEGLSSGTISVTFHVYPTAAQRTARSIGALVDLKSQYLAWAIGLELLAILALGVAGWYTLARATGVDPSIRGLGSYLGFVVVVQAAFRLFGTFGDLGPFWGLVLLVVVLSAMVRLFVAPAFVARGDGLSAAARQSAAVTTGRVIVVGSLVVAFGLATWLLGSVPVVGAFLSGALVAPIHAVSIAILVESRQA